MASLPLHNVNNAICLLPGVAPIFSLVNTTPSDGVSIMKRYVIERDLPGIGSLNRAQLKQAAATSNEALAKLDGKAQWLESYVADDKTFCVYLAEDPAAVREHAKLSGFPASKITEVRTTIDPTTANG